ncbi:MAG: LPXTG cell wall anchor domain-containing protein [Alkalibacterium sp.]|nr:LPXTG cell wall anchor domain-containing protein [Alkalibacterium sp.]
MKSHQKKKQKDKDADKDGESDEDDHDEYKEESKDRTLPDTATNIFKYMKYGGLFLISGIVLLAFLSKKLSEA